MSASTTIDLIVNQKASFAVTLYIKQSNNAVLNLSTYEVAAKYKENYQSLDSQALPFTAEITNAAAGEITISLAPPQTAAMQLGKYVYDVAITDSNGFKTRVVEGRITVSAGVS